MPNQPIQSRTTSPESGADRRRFLTKSAALILGGIACTAPVAAGFMGVFDPLRRKSSLAGPIQITTLDALPEDGLPRQFPVIAGKTDAWNKYPDATIGAVYLRRTGDGKVEALNVVCPHAGCFVDFSPANRTFLCPCHKSLFALDGSIADPKSPSPRALDSLSVKVDDAGAVWVTFQNFQAGRRDKVPLA